jgi:hypothetical protein
MKSKNNNLPWFPLNFTKTDALSKLESENDFSTNVVSIFLT